MLASFFSLVAGVLAAGQGPSVTAAPIHRVSIDVLGPVAQVQVERDLVLGEQGTKTETVLDLDLPQGASIVDWSMEVAGRPLKLTQVTTVKGRESFAAALAAQSMAPATSPSDEAAVRVHVAPLAGAVAAKLRYKYACALVLRGWPVGLANSCQLGRGAVSRSGDRSIQASGIEQVGRGDSGRSAGSAEKRACFRRSPHSSSTGRLGANLRVARRGRPVRKRERSVVLGPRARASHHGRGRVPPGTSHEHSAARGAGAARRSIAKHRIWGNG